KHGDRKCQRHLPTPSPIKGWEQHCWKELHACSARKQESSQSFSALASCEQSHGKKRDCQRIHVSAPGKFPNSQRMPCIDQDSLSCQSKRSEQLNDCPNRDSFATYHGRLRPRY